MTSKPPKITSKSPQITHFTPVAALSDRPYYLTTTAQITATRATATATLSSLNFQPLPSAANFIMTRPPVEISAEKMQDLLRKKGIIVRYFNRPDKGIDGFLRISIGTDAEMERLFDGLRAILAEI
jgi:histidinol-phosphate aminotransferase